MQYNTIRQYQEGGATRRALGQAFLGKGIKQGVEELEEEKRKAIEEGKRRGLLGSVGSFLGSVALPALATAVLGPVGLVGGALIKGAGAGLGRGLGETLGGVGSEDVSSSSTGFFAKDFDTLKDYQKSLGKGIGGRALGQAAGTALTDFALSGGLKELAEAGKYKAKGALGELRASRYSDPVTADTGAVFDETSGMYGDVNVSDFDTSLPDTSGLTTQSDVDYLSSLDRVNELGDKNLYEYSRQMSLPPSADAEMLGDVEVPSFMGDMIRSGELSAQGLPDVSGLPSKSEIDYISSLSRATETGSLNRALDMSQTAQSQAIQTSNQMEDLINYLTPKPTVADFLQMRQRAIGNYAGGGLFNPMKTGRRVF
tara:strand:+ start:6985 stop:8094 length:1110 start_codon:yes stop_codon:yes gene_type:complete